MIIFSPGPANISERVRKALTLPDICHRDSEFAELLNEIRHLILKACQVEDGYKSVVFSGSGTLAIDSAISALATANGKLLILANGVYGERAIEVARLYNLDIEEIKLPWGTFPDLNQVEDSLKKNNIFGIYLVHHETTTGLLNPLKEISLVAKNCGKMILVDAVSSIAGEVLEAQAWGIDLLIGSANKCIRGVPGASFIVASEKFIDMVKKGQRQTYYADFLAHLMAEEEGEPPFTPAVQVFYAFREALKETLEEGVAQRISHYQNISGLLRDGLKRLGLKMYLSESIISNTMTMVYLPEKFTYTLLHDVCKKRGYVIYGSQGHLKDKTFRLGTVGVVSDRDIQGFIKCLEQITKDGIRYQ